MRKKRDALATIPLDINKFYEKAIEKIRGQIESRRELALRVLTWIKYALRPLKIKELQEAIAIEDGDRSIDRESLTDIDTLITVCAGLVIADHTSGTIRFLHFTVEQYLRGRLDIFQREYHPQFQLANTCLTYLAFDWLSSKSTDPLEPSSSVSTLIESNELLQYAVDYSHRHYNFYLSGARNPACPILPNKFGEIIGDYRRRIKVFQIFFRQEPNAIQYCPNESFGKVHAASVWGLDDLLNRYLADDDTCLSALDNHGRTPLSYAVEYGWIEVVDLLLSIPKTQINIPDNLGRTPTWWGASTRSEQSLRLLLDTPGIQANNEDANGITPLIRAVNSGAAGSLRVLLDSPHVNPNLSNNGRKTALYLASQNGNDGMVKILLDNPWVTIDAEDCFGRTPLFAACHQGHEGIVRMLLERHADVNRRDSNGNVPLHAAIWGGDRNTSIIKLLLRVDGIDITGKSSWDQTPLSYAKSHDFKQVINLLTEWEMRSALPQRAAVKAVEGS